MNYTDALKVQSVKDFVGKSLETYGSDDKFEVANKVAEVVYQMLAKRKLINEYTDQTFVDYMLASCLLHNLFVDSNKVLTGEESWTDVFVAREKLLPIADEVMLPNSAVEAIFSPIEGQLGPDMPVISSVPKPGTPTELIADAIWFVKEYKSEL